jgi:SSS family solute:Na+ symporter
MHIAPLDWIIFAAGFLFFLGWAIYLNHRCRNVSDYLVSGRKVRMWLGMGAGIGGEIGLITIAAMAEQGFRNGFSFVLINLLCLVVVVPLFGVWGFGIERFRATRAMSVPEYLEMRYDRRLRILTGYTNCLAGVLQMCIFPIGGAIFVRQLLNAPVTTPILGVGVPTDWLLMLILLICPIIFTTLGGYMTLMVTNFFQGMLIMFTMTWLFVHVVNSVGGDAGFASGMQTVWTGMEGHLREASVNPFVNNADAYGWQWFIFLNVMTILLQFSYGPYLQQYAAMDKPKTVSRSYLLGAIFGFGRGLIVFGLGVAAVAALGKVAPAELSHLNLSPTEWANYATPYYLSLIGIPTVLMGLLLVGLLFADVAVTDKYMLSWATSIVNDCVQPFRRTPFEPRQHIRAVRVTIVAMCFIFFAFGLSYKPGMTLWSFMWLTANLIGGSGIVVLAGMYWRGAKPLGAYLCIAVCVIVPVADVVTRQVLAHSGTGRTLPWTPEQTGLYTYLAGAVLMVVGSLLSREQSRYWDLGVTVRALNRPDQVKASPVA